MKKLILALSIVLAITASALSDDHIPHMDRLFLNVHINRDTMISGLIENLKVFCNGAEQLSEAQEAKVKVAALESCQLLDVVNGIEESERELGIKNGLPFLARVQSGPFDEAALWRYFVRGYKTRRLMESLKTFYSQFANDTQKAKVGLVFIPKLAGSLDQHSYWSRLIAMQESSICVGKRMAYCGPLEAQLSSVAMLSLANLKISQKILVENKQINHLIGLAKQLHLRLSKMTLNELSFLEKSDNVTATGISTSYFRQFLNRMNLTHENATLADQQRLQSIFVLLEIQEAVSKWSFPIEPVSVDPEAVRVLTEELQSIIRLSGVRL